MECRECGTWNPDDKVKCWRCSAELPSLPKPRKSRKLSSQTWLWVVAILFSLLTLLAQCGFFGGEGDQGVGFGFSPTCDSSVTRLELGERARRFVRALSQRGGTVLTSSPLDKRAQCIARIGGIEYNGVPW
jgi:hypothetical protein